MRFDGKQWSAAQPIWPRLTSVTISPSHELWAVNGQAILHWRGPTFRPKEKISKDLWDLEPAETRRQKERRELERYSKHLAEGRRATKAGKYDAAAQAFSEALSAKPDDAQAYAERGYAAYLAKNVFDAQHDLEQAAKRADDRRLRAQIFFNLGLVLEARHDDGTSAFALSNFLNPTEAARKKLAGKDACALTVERGPQAVERTTYPDWLALHAGALEGANVEGKPTTSADAKRLLCRAFGFDGAGPWVMTDNGFHGFLVAESKSGLLVATVAKVEATGMCPRVAAAEIVYSSEQTLVVRATGGTGYGVRVCYIDGSTRECSTEDLERINQDQSSVEWINGCQWRGHTQHHVLDRATLTSTLTITHHDDLNEGLQESERFRVDVGDGGISVTGPGCRARFALTSAP
jgi:hypothetical protein